MNTFFFLAKISEVVSMVYEFFCLCACLLIGWVDSFAFCVIRLPTQRREKQSHGTAAPQAEYHFQPKGRL